MLVHTVAKENLYRRKMTGFKNVIKLSYVRGQPYTFVEIKQNMYQGITESDTLHHVSESYLLDNFVITSKDFFL